ncbi:hypothetical protein [Cellulosilyticum sp. I15G10I2]|uniref:hypothetical protein n=1 Tax=Cellulosilyticum sp. I15G10I2 TaxID=1892843 RepID=UPI00085CAD20|nr:hypothetical protein [Cellulosilyticum sp. I15G10I2]
MKKLKRKDLVMISFCVLSLIIIGFLRNYVYQRGISEIVSNIMREHEVIEEGKLKQEGLEFYIKVNGVYYDMDEQGKVRFFKDVEKMITREFSRLSINQIEFPGIKKYRVPIGIYTIYVDAGNSKYRYRMDKIFSNNEVIYDHSAYEMEQDKLIRENRIMNLKATGLSNGRHDLSEYEVIQILGEPSSKDDGTYYTHTVGTKHFKWSYERNGKVIKVIHVIIHNDKHYVTVDNTYYYGYDEAKFEAGL